VDNQLRAYRVLVWKINILPLTKSHKLAGMWNSIIEIHSTYGPTSHRPLLQQHYTVGTGTIVASTVD
jgi:hypothetical protein